MNSRFWILAASLLFFLGPSAQAQPAQQGKNLLAIRGKQVEVYYYPSQGGPPRKGRVLFAPGDLGMHGLAVTIAQTMASWGYDVYGVDTRQYLEAFTGKPPLRVQDVVDDFRTLVQWASAGSNEKVTLVGWSEGAGLCLAAAASEADRDRFRGLVVFGLTETNALAWHWSDFLASLVNKEASEPVFLSVDYLPQVAPLPLLVIQSTGDQYVSVAAQQKMFDTAKDPKRLVVIEAANHRFEGSQALLFRKIQEGLDWMRQEQP